MAERRTAAAAAALEQCLDAFDDLGRWTTARAPPPSPKPTPRLRTPPRPPRAEAATSSRRPLHEPKPREPEVEEVQSEEEEDESDDDWTDGDWAYCLLDGRAKRGTLTAQTEPIHVVAARKTRLEQRRALLDEHYPWDEDKGVRRDAETGRSCARLHVRVVQARSLPQMRRHRGSCDPYVEVAVDGAAPKKTGTVYDSLYPTWARKRFELRVNRKSAVLRCRVLDAPPARGEPPRPVGTCSLPLGDLGERSKTLWLPLARAPSAVKTCVEIKQ